MSDTLLSLDSKPIDFEFSNTFYNRLYNIDKSYYNKDYIFITYNLNDKYLDRILKIGDTVDYDFTFNSIKLGGLIKYHD